MRGPTVCPIAIQAAPMPMRNARLLRGTVVATMVVVPVITPEAPRPQIARPIISAVDDGAVAQTRDPISNTLMKNRKTIFRWNRRYIVPVNGVKAQLWHGSAHIHQVSDMGNKLCYQICRCIPANILYRMELVCDGRCSL